MAKKLLPIILGALAIISIIAAASWGKEWHVLQPQGPVAQQQLNLLILGTVLAAIAIIPVFAFTAFVVWKYRANKQADYQPNWELNIGFNLGWWAFVGGLIACFAVVALHSTKVLDPYRALTESDRQPITIEVVSLQYKWLFLYPEQGMATVNYVAFPEDTPVNFRLTADSPMNSFWVPQLAGQVYTMEGMTTKLHVMADNPGKFDGQSAEISGEHFAKMRFTAEAMTSTDFDHWAMSTKASSKALSYHEYNLLALPETEEETAVYSSYQAGLYAMILEKFMAHSDSSSTGHTQENPISANESQPTQSGHGAHQ